MTCMRTRNLKFGPIRPQTAEKNLQRLIMGTLVLQLSVLAGTDDIHVHESLDELKIRPYSTT